MGGWGPEIPFVERIEKPVRKNGPPLMGPNVYLPYFCLNFQEKRKTKTT